MSLSVIQRKMAVDSAGTAGFATASPTSSITAGSAILVVASCSNTSAVLFNKELQPPSGTNNNKFYLIGSNYDATFGVGIEAWVCYNAISGFESITMNDGSNDMEMAVYELGGVPYFGLHKSLFSDIAAATTYNTGNITTTIANAILIGAFASSPSDPWTAGSGYSNMQNQSGDATAGNELGVEEQIVASATTYAATATHTNSQAGVAAIIALADTASTSAACRATKLGQTFNTNSGTHTVAATPAVGDLIIIIRANTGNTASTQPTDNNADGLGGAGGYTLATSALKNTSADLLEVWVRKNAIGNASSTTFSDAAGTTTGGGLHVYKVTGMSRYGTSAIKQVATTANQAANATLAPTFSANPLTTNVVFVAGFNTTNNASANFVLPNNIAHGLLSGYGTPATSLLTGFSEGANTATAQTFTAQSPTVCCAVAVELDTSAAPVALHNLFFQAVRP